MLGLHFWLYFVRLLGSLLSNFSDCIELSTTPFPVCILRLQYSISIFRFLQNFLYTLEIIAPPLSDFIFSGIPYKVKILIRKLISSFVSEVLQVSTVGHLLNLSTAISICTSPCKFLLCNFPVKSICIS